MVFSLGNEFGTRYGNVEGITLDLSNVNLTIRDSSSKSTNSSDILEHGVVVETDGNFNCTFLDENSNGKLDEEDKFIVHNASAGDWVKLYLKSSGEEVAYYIF